MIQNHFYKMLPKVTGGTGCCNIRQTHMDVPIRYLLYAEKYYHYQYYYQYYYCQQ
jgi:hypothetical protein